ncbi:MAG TPA: serine hydrolase [Candidatus Baltobacteraceae bacterium]|nr:serine hydrolase [Candidatus Baltobacteraceae bacterium]
MRVPRPAVAAVVSFAATLAAFSPAGATDIPGPLAAFQDELSAYTLRAPGHVAIAVEDVATGLLTGVNATAEMPAASTIKIPVMVEVFRQLVAGRFDLNTRRTLLASDKDWGSGDLCAAPAGSTYTVSHLLSVMIDDSDNTATNMLIRLVGRQNINATMLRLGLTHTRLNDFIRSNGPIRWALRSTPADMTHLLTVMAKDRLIDEWSSREMIRILAADRINTLLPVPLPPGTTIAHKTGSLHDTLNDVGIVYPSDEQPYVIAVMTTDLSSLSAGRSFIHGVSRMAYSALSEFESWRVETGFDPLGALPEGTQPDETGATAATPASTPAMVQSPDKAMWTPVKSEPAIAPGAAPAQQAAPNRALPAQPAAAPTDTPTGY